jgi:hypothetical protein
MADFAPIRTALEGWVTALTGLPTQWKDRPLNQRFKETGYCELYISGDLTVGNDEVNDEYDDTQPQGSQIRTFQEGARTFVFGVKIITWIEKDNEDAEYYARELRDQLALPKKSAALLRAANLAVATIQLDAPIETTVQEGRSVSVHQFDIKMNTTSRREDTPGTWIETAPGVELQVPPGTTVATFDIDT